MNLSIDHNIALPAQALARTADSIRAGDRRKILKRAAYAVADLVRRHILRIAPSRHITAARLGAQPTEFFGKAARRTTSSATQNHALVTIGSAGFSRAFRAVSIRPKNGKRFLTIPTSADSYGLTVKEMRSHAGWKIYRPGSARILIGVKDGRRVPLFALAEQAHQRQDRSLLPGDRELGETAAQAAMKEVVSQIELGRK